MKNILEKANQALLEGDRDGVLHLLRDEPETPEVIWLRANSVLSNEERLNLLNQLTEGESIYSRLAREYLEREKKLEQQLQEPPDYQFWKQPTWAKRLEKMRAYRIWGFGAVMLIIMIVFGSLLNRSVQDQYQQEYLIVQATQTAAAVYGQTIAKYASGTLSALKTEDPTTQRVTFGQTQDDQFILATPAAGARFVAVQLNFFCDIALCASPPEATINLLLANGQIVSYNSSSKPFLIEQPIDSLPRISQGQFAPIWFVFEVPKTSSPLALQIISEEQEVPQYISWPLR